jgi:hypothetical protein
MENKLITKEQYEVALKITHQYMKQVHEEFERVKIELKGPLRFNGVKRDSFVLDVNLSARCANAIFHYLSDKSINRRDARIGDLEGVDLRDMIRYRNFGKCGLIELRELRDLCISVGVSFVNPPWLK